MEERGLGSSAQLFPVEWSLLISSNAWFLFIYFLIYLEAYLFRMSTIEPFLYQILVELVDSWVIYILCKMSHNRSVSKWFVFKIISDLEPHPIHEWAFLLVLPYNTVFFPHLQLSIFLSIWMSAYSIWTECSFLLIKVGNSPQST